MLVLSCPSSHLPSLLFPFEMQRVNYIIGSITTKITAYSCWIRVDGQARVIVRRIRPSGDGMPKFVGDCGTKKSIVPRGGRSGICPFIDHLRINLGRSTGSLSSPLF